MSSYLCIFNVSVGDDDQASDWPPTKPLIMRRALEEEENEGTSATFFVKVYMEGIPIGRKLDLLAHDGYHDLIRTLDYMFSTNIICKLVNLTVFWWSFN